MATPAAAQQPLRLRATRRRWGEDVVKVVLALCALVSVLTTVGIVAVGLVVGCHRGLNGGVSGAANPLGVPLSGPLAGAVTRGYHLAAMPGNRVRVAADWLLDAVLPRQGVQLGLVRSWSVPLDTASPETARVAGAPERTRDAAAERTGDE